MTTKTYNRFSLWFWRKVYSFRRNYAFYFIFISWISFIAYYIFLDKTINYPALSFLTVVLLFLWGEYIKGEKRYNKNKNSIKNLYNDYFYNVELSAAYSQSRSKSVEELSFSKYSLKFMKIVIEENLISNKKLMEYIVIDFRTLSWYNRVWYVLAKEVVLDNIKISDKKVLKFLDFNDNVIYPQLGKNKELIKKYYEKKYYEVLK